MYRLPLFILTQYHAGVGEAKDKDKSAYHFLLL